MKAQNARGTRDFSPMEIKKRHYIIQHIKKYFELYGFLPIETPAIENLSTLTGKYGEEGDQLLFKILNSRLHESTQKNILKEEFNKMLEKSYHSEYITERALRYDLTVPFARYVSQYRHQIQFPFKRYQIQPVWRADKPQKGRYREFVQCDADAIGTTSLLMEIELILLINDVFKTLMPSQKVLLKINHRKILEGIIEWMEAKDKFHEILAIIDKLDKVDESVVQKELEALPINPNKLQNFFNIIYQREKVNIDHILYIQGMKELEYVLDLVKVMPLSIEIELDLKLARGLNYYTGMIFETKMKDSPFTYSILGGGRYDNLTGIFDMPGVSGVGISFGIDRIYDVMDTLQLFPENIQHIYPTSILLIYFDESYLSYILSLAHTMRENEISVEIYHQVDKLKKIMEYAHKKKFPFVGIVGEEEFNTQRISIKNMQSGQQEKINISELILYLKNTKSI